MVTRPVINFFMNLGLLDVRAYRISGPIARSFACSTPFLFSNSPRIFGPGNISAMSSLCLFVFVEGSPGKAISTVTAGFFKSAEFESLESDPSGFVGVLGRYSAGRPNDGVLLICKTSLLGCTKKFDLRAQLTSTKTGQNFRKNFGYPPSILFQSSHAVSVLWLQEN